MASENYDPEKTAYDENYEEVIYHLDLEPDTVELVAEHFGRDEADLICHHCDERAVWYVGEIKEVGPRVDSLFCDSCIMAPFVALWEEWPWTPDDER